MDGDRTTESNKPTQVLTSSGLTPRTIGRYHLKRVIASGGMGTVYEAVQERPRRTVALKLMSRRVTSPTAVRRFESEEQILGRLHHPGIAQIYDAGMYDDGSGPVPYFVMEYIANSKSITDYAHAAELELREKLELFAEVCDAVEHGHGKGVIHRDLKPDNILVDSTGHPKIIDFGVARATDSDLVVTTLQTAVGQLVGTVQYMSPEQIEADPHDIDARSDVYSLGVVLYELLCGRLPHDVTGRRLVEATRVIREEPAIRIGSVDRSLRGDIETIVQTSLRKNRERRYRTAAELAEDIRRYLRGAPIHARRERAGYTVRVTARREAIKHPLVSCLIAGVVAALAAWYVGVPIVYRWTPAHRLYERMVTLHAGVAVLEPVLDAVRIITLTETTEPAAIADEQALPDFAPEDVRSLRRLHGRLMEQLSRCRPRVVVWDIAFPEESIFDADFVRGVEALRESGVDVIVAVPSWRRDEHGLPDTSPAILASGVRWGTTTGRFQEGGAWSLDLVVHRGAAEPMASLALAAHMAGRHPGAPVSMTIEAGLGNLDIRYWRPNPVVPRFRQLIDDPELVALSDVQREVRGSGPVGLERGDVVASYLLDVPDHEALSAVSVEYGDVLRASDGQLRLWFGGRTVVIGNTRGDIDRHAYPDGRRIYGCYAHAVGIDALARTAAIRLPRPWHVIAMLLGGAAVGSVIAVWSIRTAWRRWTAYAVVMLLSLFGCLLAFRLNAYLCNPLVPLMAMVAGGELAAPILRLRIARHVAR